MNQESVSHPPEKEPGTLDITVAVYGVLTILACGCYLFLSSSILFYRGGLGTYDLNPMTMAGHFFAALGFLIAVIAGIVIKLCRRRWNPTIAETLTLLILLTVNLLAPVLSFTMGEPGYKPHARGFADRTRKDLVITPEVRTWMRDQLRQNPAARFPLQTCPAFVTSAFHDLIAPWHHWEVVIDEPDLVRLETGGGLDEPWGVAVRLNRESPTTSNAKEFRVPVDDEVFVYQKLGR